MKGLESSREVSRAGEPSGDPAVADGHEGVTIAGATGWCSEGTGHEFRLQVDQVVAAPRAPGYLSDAIRGARAEGFFPFEEVVLTSS